MKHRLFLISLLLILGSVSLFIGVQSVQIKALFALDSHAWEIMNISRVPRLISIILAGMSISICGLMMQQITRNKFVSPTTAGTMDAARLGLLTVIILMPSASVFVKISSAFVFSFVISLVFIRVLQSMPHKDDLIVPLIGIMLGQVISAFTTFIALKYDLMQSLGAWLEGDFSMVLSGRYELLYISIPLFLLCYFMAHQITIASLGEDTAVSFGLNYKKVVLLALVLIALMSTSVLVTIGDLPFLGLIIPNLVTLFYGDAMRKAIFPTALYGAIFLLVCDIFSRLIVFPYEISISVTISVIGGIIFLYLIARRKEHDVA